MPSENRAPNVADAQILRNGARAAARAHKVGQVEDLCLAATVWIGNDQANSDNLQQQLHGECRREYELELLEK